MKFSVELTKSQYNKLAKRSEMLGQAPEDAAKMVLSVLTDGSDAEFIEYLELNGTPSIHRNIEDEDMKHNISDEWEYNDEDDQYA